MSLARARQLSLSAKKKKITPADTALSLGGQKIKLAESGMTTAELAAGLKKLVMLRSNIGSLDGPTSAVESALDKANDAINKAIDGYNAELNKRKNVKRKSLSLAMSNGQSATLRILQQARKLVTDAETTCAKWGGAEIDDLTRAANAKIKEAIMLVTAVNDED